ncbi:hypothetical protein ACVME8_001307 [Bradyrhizobium diazoefficiens]
MSQTRMRSGSSAKDELYPSPVRSDIRALLARNASRMEKGFETLRQHARTDAPGREFLGAFFAWCSDVLASSRKLLASERC